MGDPESGTVEAETLRATTVDAPAAGTALLLDPKGSSSNIAIGDIIGEGGMGVVRSAHQRSLDRHVAIKTVHPGASKESEERMLREAWVTGWLEHPGVVPVHDIVKDAGGAPIVVMRRIQGATWEDRLRDEAWAASHGAVDLLEQNLRILVRVCEIVEFAHDRGVMHRDIKPANVMLGAFGEVYLLDWGLALALDERAAAHLPLAAKVNEMCGTLAYVPPEMIGGTDAGLDVRTDVYLVGAVLFEVVTGRPPHDRPTTAAVLQSVAASPPTVPPEVPARLAAVCTKAMQRDAAARYPSVAALRHDVLEFLRARDSERLSAGAEATLAKLREACARNEPRQRLYDLYGTCRLGFREALRGWPGNVRAAHGLSAAAELMLARELESDPRVAGALLDEITAEAGQADSDPPLRTTGRLVARPPPISRELVARIRSAVVAEASERAGLKKLKKNLDRRIGHRTRKLVFASLGVTWLLAQPAMEWLGPQAHLQLALVNLLQLPVVALAWGGISVLSRTAFNRRAMWGAIVFLFSQASLYVAGAVLGVPVATLRVLDVGLSAVVISSFMAFQEPNVWPTAIGFTVAFAACLVAPEHRFAFSSVAAVSILVNVVFMWRKDTRAVAR